MKKSLKGIIAGVVAMFVFVPVAYAAEITEVNITIAAPKVGDKITVTTKKCSYTIPAEGETPAQTVEYDCIETKPTPSVTLGGTNYGIENIGEEAIWLKKLPSEVTDVDPSNFEAFDAAMHYTNDELNGLTFEAGKEYGVEIPLVVGNMAEDEFAANLVVKVNGKTTGFETTKQDGVSEMRFIVYAKVAAGEGTTDKEETTEEAATAAIKVLEGAAQKYDATGSDRLRFRFNLDYASFKASGKIFVDGNEVDSKNYESEEGSTIIIFTKAFTDTLKAGNHTMKLTSDEGEVETTFNVTKAVANPQTGDNIYAYVSLAVISILGLAVSKKKLFN